MEGVRGRGTLVASLVAISTSQFIVARQTHGSEEGVWPCLNAN
jgi:hypothetical protein